MIVENKEYLINKMNNYAQVLIPDTLKALDQLPNDIDGKLYIITDPGKLRIAVIYTPSKYLALRRRLAKEWKYHMHHFNEHTGNYYVYFSHRQLQVQLSLEIEFPKEFENGTNCRLVEIGHTTKPIYGLECR